MTVLGKPTINKFRCKTEWIKCIYCGKLMERRLNITNASVTALHKNRKTCSTKCSRAYCRRNKKTFIPYINIPAEKQNVLTSVRT